MESISTYMSVFLQVQKPNFGFASSFSPLLRYNSYMRSKIYFIQSSGWPFVVLCMYGCGQCLALPFHLSVHQNEIIISSDEWEHHFLLFILKFLRTVMWNSFLWCQSSVLREGSTFFRWIEESTFWICTTEFCREISLNGLWIMSLYLICFLTIWW